MNHKHIDTQFKEAIDYACVNIKDPQYHLISQFNTFMNDPTIDVHMTPTKDYYKILQLFKNEEFDHILPFQLITIEQTYHHSEGGSHRKSESTSEFDGDPIVLWLGIYNNLLMTCDYYVSEENYEKIIKKLKRELFRQSV